MKIKYNFKKLQFFKCLNDVLISLKANLSFNDIKGHGQKIYLDIMYYDGKKEQKIEQKNRAITLLCPNF